MYEDTVETVSTNFFADNYIVIILIAVIVIMTIIGYIADKKDFGKKDDVKKEKKNKKNKKNEKQEPVDIGQELIAENNEQINQNEPADIIPPGEDIIDSFAMPSDFNPADDNQTIVPESIDNGVAPIEDIQSATELPVEDIQPTTELPVEEPNLENNVVDPSVDVAENNTDAINDVVNSEEVPVENQDINPSNEERISVDDWNVNEPTAEEKEAMALDTNASSDDFKLPNIENLDEQLIDNNDEADVWKF